MVTMRSGYFGYTNTTVKNPVQQETELTVPSLKSSPNTPTDRFAPKFGAAITGEDIKNAAKDYLDGRKDHLRKELRKVGEIKYIVLWKKYEARLEELKGTLQDLREEEREVRDQAKALARLAKKQLEEDLRKLQSEVAKWKAALKVRTDNLKKLPLPGEGTREQDRQWRELKASRDQAQRELNTAEDNYKRRDGQGIAGPHDRDAQDALRRAGEIHREIIKAEQELGRLQQFRMQTSLPQTLVDNMFSVMWIKIGNLLGKAPVPVIKNAGDGYRDKGQALARKIMEEGLKDAQEIAEGQFRQLKAELRKLGIRV